MAFNDLMSSEYKNFCDPSVDIPVTVNGSAVAVQRGNCTFSDKARLAQSRGIHAVIIVSESLVGLSSCIVLMVFAIMIVNIEWERTTVNTYHEPY